MSRKASIIKGSLIFPAGHVASSKAIEREQNIPHYNISYVLWSLQKRSHRSGMQPA